jgi:hypothetical protein
MDLSQISGTTTERMIRREVLEETERLLGALEPLDPPSWRTSGCCPVATLELERANRYLRRGAHARDVAFGLALTRAARTWGAGPVQDATRDLVHR